WLNEHITGKRWPAYSIRLDMLKEAVGIMRELWSGNMVTSRKRHFIVENARIYTLPEKLPPIYLAASGPESATVAGELAAGLIGTTPNKEMTRRFTEAGGKQKPRIGQMTVCWASTLKKAKETALKYWRTGSVPGPVKVELALPSQMEAASSL